MFVYCTTALIALVLCGTVLSVGDNPVVTLADGTKIRGVTKNHVTSFKGIPYAAPPVGELRWTPPTKWVNPDPSVVIDGSQFGDVCKQLRDGVVKGSEDCLYLNVYVHMNNTMKSPDLPVGFYIHGGSYKNGEGSDYDGTDFINFWDGQTVIVSINYRLNVFGFSASKHLRPLDADGSTGNYGIQDQRFAMEWVQENIGAFGGNRDDVMIYGESAGAGSITNHMSMKRSWGLFASATLESGSFSEWVTQPVSVGEVAYQSLAEAMNCSPTDLECMQSKSTAEIFNASLNIPSTDQNYGTPYNPTVDGVELTTHPWIKLYNGDVVDVPVMHGTNRDEGSMFYPMPIDLDEAGLTAYWESFGVYDEQNIETLKKLYVEGKTYPVVEMEDGQEQPTVYWWAGMRWMGDLSFTCPAKYTSQQLSRHQTSGKRQSNTHTYFFEYHADGSSVPWVEHTAEIPFIFHMHGYISSKEDYGVANIMSTYWGNFLAGRDPNARKGRALQMVPAVHEGVFSSSLRSTQTSYKGKFGQYGTPVNVPHWPIYVAATDVVQEVVNSTSVHPQSSLKKEECHFHNSFINADIRAKFLAV